MIEQKIAEIVEQLCIVCPSEITCGFDMREKASKAILALIASEQAPLKQALINMCYQFAYDGKKNGKTCVCTGGLSPLEDAFEVLGWDNPHFVEEIPFKDIGGKHD